MHKNELVNVEKRRLAINDGIREVKGLLRDELDSNTMYVPDAYKSTASEAEISQMRLTSSCYMLFSILSNKEFVSISRLSKENRDELYLLIRSFTTGAERAENFVQLELF